ncbi:glycoside hydrolase family 75 protein [Podospora fimiseda]|uniref:Endo-chitosanase n=1 Tax=Podospora fimiseda TaxID=252190 RepID=A0AAN7BE43_9PEZI|nr:glycoside hydrolase family 75 protein [Podospora fimiseda]
MLSLSFPFLVAILAFTSSARDVPPNVRNFYNTVKGRGDCKLKLATGFSGSASGSNTHSYCGDYANSTNIVYIKGPGQSFANMDIDCDGEQGGPNDGRCRGGDTKSATSFQAIVRGYNKGIQDLNANIHPYVVFGNLGSQPGWRTFEPQKVDILPLSIVAVVCGNQLIYGIWGDINGDDDGYPVVGEASISLATACYGNGMTSDAGHDEDDVLYIAFRGSSAVPGANGANWAARSYTEFEKSIEPLGNALVAMM